MIQFKKRRKSDSVTRRAILVSFLELAQLQLKKIVPMIFFVADSKLVKIDGKQLPFILMEIIKELFWETNLKKCFDHSQL